MDGILRPMLHSDLDRVLTWRNQEHIRKNMYTHHEISQEEHLSWWQCQSIHPQTRLMIFELCGEAVGFVSFTQYTVENGLATWAFYSGDASRKGLGRLMEYHALSYAFETLNIRKLNCEVLSFNQAVIRMHQRYGFALEGVFKEAYVREGEAFDIYRLSMLSKDWFKRIKAFFEQPTETNLVGKVYQRTVSIDASMIAVFAEVSLDHNPIHFEQHAARQAGFKNQIAHGLLGVSLFSGIFGTKIDPKGLIYLTQSAQFLKPVYIGSDAVIEVKISSHIGRQISAETSLWVEGELMLTGVATLLLPKAI